MCLWQRKFPRLATNQKTAPQSPENASGSKNQMEIQGFYSIFTRFIRKLKLISNAITFFFFLFGPHVTNHTVVQSSSHGAASSLWHTIDVDEDDATPATASAAASVAVGAAGAVASADLAGRSGRWAVCCDCVEGGVG